MFFTVVEGQTININIVNRDKYIFLSAFSWRKWLVILAFISSVQAKMELVGKKAMH